MGKLSREIFALQHYTMHKLYISLINKMAFKLLLHKIKPLLQIGCNFNRKPRIIGSKCLMGAAKHFCTAQYITVDPENPTNRPYKLSLHRQTNII
jgi:hypothetical protein